MLTNDHKIAHFLIRSPPFLSLTFGGGSRAATIAFGLISQDFAGSVGSCKQRERRCFANCSQKNVNEDEYSLPRQIHPSICIVSRPNTLRTSQRLAPLPSSHRLPYVLVPYAALPIYPSRCDRLADRSAYQQSSMVHQGNDDELLGTISPERFRTTRGMSH